jgi:hypothetical protein
VEPLVVRAARVDPASQTFEYKSCLGKIQVVCDFTRHPNVSHMGSDFLVVDRLEILAPISKKEFEMFLEELQVKFADGCYQIMFFNTSALASKLLISILGEPARVGLECDLTPPSRTDLSQHSI